MDYKKDLKINSNLMEKELEKQPLLYMEYAEQHADAILEKEKAKQRIDLLYIEIDLEYRTDREVHWGAKRPTEKEIEGKVLSDPRYVEAQRNYSQMCHNVNVLAGAKEAISQKKAILGNIVAMKIAGLYSTPKPMGDQKRALVRLKTTKNSTGRRA